MQVVDLLDLPQVSLDYWSHNELDIDPIKTLSSENLGQVQDFTNSMQVCEKRTWCKLIFEDLPQVVETTYIKHANNQRGRLLGKQRREEPARAIYISKWHVLS